MLGLTNPNAQVYLRRAWLDTEKDRGGPDDDWLYSAGSATTTAVADSSRTSSCKTRPGGLRL